MLDITITLKQNLETLLARRDDMSRLNLSRIMGVSDGALGRIKYGTGNPTVDVLERIARFFHISPWQMLAPDLGAEILGRKGKPDELQGPLEMLRALPEPARELVIAQIKNLAYQSSGKVNHRTQSESGTMLVNPPDEGGRPRMPKTVHVKTLVTGDNTHGVKRAKQQGKRHQPGRTPKGKKTE